MAEKREPVTHELKTGPQCYSDIVKRVKTFEIRFCGDRDFQVGDFLKIREFMPCPKCKGTGRVWDSGDKTDCAECSDAHGRYTGYLHNVEVTYIVRGLCYGVPENFCVMAIRPKE